MTTVAYKAGQMACDSCWSNNGLHVTSMTKIDRLASGALLGAAGDADIRSLLVLLDKIRQPAKLPSKAELEALKTDFAALFVFPKGQLFMLASGTDDRGNWHSEVYPVTRGYAAVGSGKELAIGAMAAGKSAKEAVAIACRHDLNSRPPVYAVSL